jgi:protein-L-isoaspartate(D-aspartate) O-methyltransferase
LLERVGDARVVLLGEATHGTSEFYRMRARITEELICRHGFTMVAVEADWPDATRVDHYVRHRPPSPVPTFHAFDRFPTWMWRNREVVDFAAWLHERNGTVEPDSRAGFYGLDLYSLYRSAAMVLAYLDEVDPDAARVARARYGCLTPWEGDPATYGRVALSGRYQSCEQPVIDMLIEMVERQLEFTRHDGDRYIDALQNARVVADAERYYRAMYYGGAAAWNLRDRHMFDTLQILLQVGRPGAKAVVWAHNSHIGDASATEMAARGELNIGQLCRQHYGDGAYLVGFGTDHGTVAAADEWDGPVRIKPVRPSLPDSYERLFHSAEKPAFMLHLRDPVRQAVRDELGAERLERAIGVIYRPETERLSHYFRARLPEQFDAYIWFDESHAVTPLAAPVTAGPPDTFPFGL